MFVYYNKVSSIVFKLMISLYAIKNHKGFDFLGLLNFSRDILLLLLLLILIIIIIIAIIIIIITMKCLFVYSILNPTGI